MVRKPIWQGKHKDIEAVCNIAHTLLGLGGTVGVRGTMGLLAEDFAGAPANTTAKDLLQVRANNHVRCLADDRMSSIHFFKSTPRHSAYDPLTSFAQSLGSTVGEPSDYAVDISVAAKASHMSNDLTLILNVLPVHIRLVAAHLMLGMALQIERPSRLLCYGELANPITLEYF